MYVAQVRDLAFTVVSLGWDLLSRPLSDDDGIELVHGEHVVLVFNLVIVHEVLLRCGRRCGRGRPRRGCWGRPPRLPRREGRVVVRGDVVRAVVALAECYFRPDSRKD